MPNHDGGPRRNADTAAQDGTGAPQGRATRLGLSIGGGVLSLAALQSAALAGPCSTGVVLESPDRSTIISPDGAVSCIVLPGGDALLSLDGQVTPLVPLGAPTGPTTYSYDSQGQLPSETDSLGTTTMSYDFSGQPTAATDVLGRVTTYTYQYGAGGGELTQVTQPGGSVTTYEYDGGRLTSETLPGGSTVTFTYDPGSVTETATGGNVTTYTYDSRNNITTGDAVGRVTTYTYDGGQLTAITDPTGGGRTFTYDYAAGLIGSSTDPIGNITTYTYDARPQLVTDTGNSDGAANFAYAASVPEPSTLAVLLSGLAGWIGLRRRR
ncbi:MAG: PEP-CTERM sorting domain-containing protein [Acetobacteraceae bacterium]|jgi:YD repeat-containing protein